MNPFTQLHGPMTCDRCGRPTMFPAYYLLERKLVEGHINNLVCEACRKGGENGKDRRET